MQGKKVRQRVNPTYSQTFFFSDPPLQSKTVEKCQPYCSGRCPDCRNIIEHPITRSETSEQKLHKQTLGHPNEQEEPKPYFWQFVPGQVSTVRKEQQLRGQLEEGGVSFFFRERTNNPCAHHGGRLIPSDCKFNHTCHGTVGPMNEHCQYPNRHFDWLLKQKYDFKHDKALCSEGPTYVFREKGKRRKK